MTTMNEELRRLTPDLVFEEVLVAFAADHGCHCLGQETAQASQ